MVKHKKSSLAIIFLTVFIDLLGFGIIIPIVPFFLEEYFISPEHAGKILGLLMTAFSLMQFIFAPILGRLSDKIGRRPIILISLLGSAATHFMFALAPNLAVLFIARIFTGIFGATVPTAMAYIADITSRENRARGMGLIGMAFGLGFVFGPAIGGVLSHYGLRIPIFAAGILSLASFILAWFRLGESRTQSSPKYTTSRNFAFTNLVKALKHPNLGYLFVIFFLVTLSFTSLETIFAYFVERKFSLNSVKTGLLFGYIGFISASIQGGLIGPLSKKFGEIKLIVFATLLLTLTFFALPFVGSFLSFMIVLGILSIAIGLHNPSVLSLISKNASVDEQGGILGINQSFSSLARIIGPFWAGYFFDHFGIQIPFWASSILLLTAFLLTFILFRKNLHQSTKSQEEVIHES